MKVFVRSFRRREDGSWQCVAPAEFIGPNGRMEVTAGTVLTPGRLFMGVDLAKWLDEQAEKDGLLNRPE
jgi:hypothetical protein